MLKGVFLLIGFLLMGGQISAADDIRLTGFTNGICSHNPNMTDMIGRNISKYFCIIGCEIPDSTKEDRIKKNIQTAIEMAYPDNPELKGQMPYLQYIYTIEGHENLIFFSMPNPIDVHSGLHVVLNQRQNKYYVLPRISLAELDTLLSTEKFNLSADGWLLQFCVLISSVYYYPCCPLRIIGSNGELLLLATLENAGYDMGDAQEYSNIKIEMPTIKRYKDSTEVSYYLAVGDVVQKVQVNLMGSKILGYKETNIARIPGLFGPIPY